MENTAFSEARTSGKAIASFVLGLFSWTCIPAIPGLILGIWALADISARPAQLKGNALAILGIVFSGLGVTLAPVIGMVVALLLPAVQAGREAARRAECMNNLKQIGFALHDYTSEHGRFPAAAIADVDSGEHRSWRIELLPSLGQEALYDQYDKSEAWDGPTNKALVDRRPAVYHCPSNSGPSPSATDYAVLRGGGAMFPHDGPGPSRKDIADGMSNTIAVVEAHDLKIPWSEPRDIDAIRLLGDAGPANDPRAALSSKHPGGFNALFADGSVRFIADDTDPATLRALITRSGGE